MSPQTPGFFWSKIWPKSMSKTRLLLLLLLLPFLINSSVFAQGKIKTAKIKQAQVSEDSSIEVKKMDSRAVILQAYLEQHNSPLKYHSQDFIEAADKYNLDWKLVASIAGVESTFGKFIPGGYNAWGWGVYGNQALYFNSWRDGIFTVSEGLRKGYLNKGLTDPYTINQVYAASPTWGSKVTYFLNDIEEFKTQYKKEIPSLEALNILNQNAGNSGTLALK